MYGRCFLANSSYLALFTAYVSVPRSYIMQTDVSIISISVSRGECGLLLRWVNTSVASGKTSHVCHADFLPFPRNADTVSHPVKAWKKGSPNKRIPRSFEISCIGSHRKSLFLPKPIHNFSNPNC